MEHIIREAEHRILALLPRDLDGIRTLARIAVDRTRKKPLIHYYRNCQLYVFLASPIASLKLFL